MSEQRLSELRSLISRADAAYYNTGEAVMDDAAYDRLRDELAQLCPTDPLLKSVGSAISRANILQSVTHRIPMGSQRKAMNRDEFFAWVETTGATRFHASLKKDGGSAEFEYRDGALACASTRGDGRVGQDITANALKFRGLPKRGVTLDGTTLFTGSVRGEVMLLTADWAKVDPEMLTNPRNLGNGIAGRKDGTQSELLTVFAFRAYDDDGAEVAATETEMSAKLAAAGFQVAESRTGSAEEVRAWFDRVLEGRAALPFWIDGVVVKVDDIAAQNALGASDDRPKGQVAMKFPAMGQETVVENVVITVGHTGAVIPTATLRPVQIGGTTIASALLCNWVEIAALDVALGDRVRVIKAGDIIPKILEVIERPETRRAIAKPPVCPVCGGAVGHKTTVAGEQSANLYCLNDECEAKSSGKVKRWVKSLDILGIGEEVLASLVDQMGLKDAADLYTLKDRVGDLAGVAMASGVRIGLSRAESIVQEIQAKEELTIEEFVGSLGIEALGKRRVELIRQKVPGQMDTLADWMSGKLDTIAEEAGVPNVAARIVADLEAKRALVERLVAAGVRIKASAVKATAPAGATSVCITGALSKPKAYFADLIAAKGWEYKDSVAKGLTYLVMADPSSKSSKAEKARKLGVQCIGEDELLKLLGS